LSSDPSCSSNATEIDPLINTKYSELFVPAKTLAYGLYNFELRVTMNYSSDYSISKSLCVKITPSNITANLIKYGTSMITSGHTKNLTLNPGEYSIDPDAEASGFNASVSQKHTCLFHMMQNLVHHNRTGNMFILVGHIICIVQLVIFQCYQSNISSRNASPIDQVRMDI